MTSAQPPLADHLVHSGRPDSVDGRHVNFPVELGSTMVFDTLAAFETARDRRYESGALYYGRYGNTASYALETALRGLENADDVTLASSGVAAISCTLLALTKPGDHLLVADHVYGNTRMFCETVLRRQGVEVEFYDPMVGAGIDALIRPETTAVMFEAPGSGTFETPDISEISRAARAAGAVSVLDNTWASAVLCKPLDLGVDVSVWSGSKYLCGHSDCMLGVIASRGPVGLSIRKMVMAIGDKTGGQEVFLALRRLRTLKMRMEHVDRAGRAIAAWLAERPQVATILHPAFESCPGHANWKRAFTGSAGLFGAVFHPASATQVRAFVDSLHLFGIGVSWGGYESLVLPVSPARTATNWDTTGPLIRFNIGFEDIDSLKADLAAALPHLNTAEAKST